MKKINVAVIGAGVLGEIHAETFFQYQRSELLWICDISQDRAERLARKYKCRFTTDSRDIAGDREVRAVSIATPDFAHTDIAIEMIRAGKDIFIEKPLATTVPEAELIVNEAKKAGVRLMVDFQNRWSPTFSYIKKSINSNEIGKPLMGYIRLSNPIRVPLKMLSWASKSGPQWFLFPHTIDLARWFIGQEASEVYAVGTKGILKEKGIDTYDAIQANIKFKTGAFITFETSWILPDSWPSNVDFKMMLLGSKGKIDAHGDHQAITVSSQDSLSWPFTLGIQEIEGKKTGFFKESILHFIDSICEERQPNCTGNDGLAVTKIISGIVESIEGNKLVKF